MLAWILGVSNFDKFLTQLADTVKNVSSAHCRKLVTVSKIKVAHTNAGRLYTSKKELQMLVFGCGVLPLCTYWSLNLTINRLNQFRKKIPTCYSTTQITHRLILLLQRQDTSLSRCLIWLWKDGFIENRIRDLFRGCNDLKWLCFKKANKRVRNLKWAHITGKYFPSVTHTAASAEQANVYQDLKLIKSVNYFTEIN